VGGLAVTYAQGVVRTPFGTTWDELELEHLRAFFAERRNEGLTWEARGGQIRPEHVRAGVCAFGNSVLGGYLIMGASQDRDSGLWALEGWEPRTEPELWIGDCLSNDGVRPAPSHLVKSWSLGPSLWVAVLSVRPVAVPPCLTSSGEVWERLSGKSVRVTDPASLRRLFERGEAAMARAAQGASDARQDLASAPPEGRQCKIVVALASPSLPADVSAAVFRQATYDRLRELLTGPLRADPPEVNRLGGEVSQHALSAWSLSSFHSGEGYAMRVGRHGAVAVGRSDPDLDSGLRVAADDPNSLLPMWAAAVTLLRDLGAEGPAHVAVRLWDGRRGETDLARWSAVTDPGAQELESIQREAQRALGQPAWEP